MQSLSAIFRTKASESHQKSLNIKECQITLDPERALFQIQLFYPYDIVKTYRLNFIDTQSLRAVIDKKSYSSSFIINAKLLKEYLEYFEAKAEEVHISVSESPRYGIEMTSFTEGATFEKGITIDCLIIFTNSISNRNLEASDTNNCFYRCFRI